MKNLIAGICGATVGLVVVGGSAFGEYSSGTTPGYELYRANLYDNARGADDVRVSCIQMAGWPGLCDFQGDGGPYRICYDNWNFIETIPAFNEGVQMSATFEDGDCTHLGWSFNSDRFQDFNELNQDQIAGKSATEVFDLSCNPTGTGAEFECTGDCAAQVIQLQRGMTSGPFNTNGERWFVAVAPVNGWQASNEGGRTIAVNGVTVLPGATLPPPAADGNYYFYFSAGNFDYASWSFW